jgi:hypothetical protein
VMIDDDDLIFGSRGVGDATMKIIIDQGID